MHCISMARCQICCSSSRDIKLSARRPREQMPMGSKWREKCRYGVLPPFSPPFPSQSLPLPFSSLFSLLPCLSLPSFLPFLSLEVGPLNPARGSGAALQASPAGSGAEPQPKSILVHFSPQIGLLVAKFCKDYPENELAKFHVFRSLPAPPQILPWSSGAPDERGPLSIGSPGQRLVKRL